MVMTDAAPASFGDGGEWHYGMGASKWREGRCGGAHSASDGVVGEVGDGRVAEDEDGVDGGHVVLLWLLSMMGTRTRSA